MAYSLHILCLVYNQFLNVKTLAKCFARNADVLYIYKHLNVTLRYCKRFRIFVCNIRLKFIFTYVSFNLIEKILSNKYSVFAYVIQLIS